MKTQKTKLTIVLLIIILFMVVFAALYNAYIHMHLLCVHGGFIKDVSGEEFSYYICEPNQIEVTRLYRNNSVLETVVTFEATSQ
jgi:hypothetical protein